MQNIAPAFPTSKLILMYQKMSNVCGFKVADGGVKVLPLAEQNFQISF